MFVFYSRGARGDRGVCVLQQKCWRGRVLVFYSRSAGGDRVLMFYSRGARGQGCCSFTAEVLQG